MKIRSIITEAAVYLHGAQITRTQRFKVKKGKNKVIFGSLPIDITEQSITASPDDHAIITSVSYSKTLSNSKNKRVSELLKKLEALRKELDIANEKMNILLEEEKLVKANSQIPGGKIFRSSDIKDMADFFRERMSSICSEKISDRKEIKRLSDEIAEIESKIGIDEMTRQMSQVEIDVHSSNDSETEITISYFTHSAFWTPYYDVNVKDVSSPVVISSKAMVYQNTGEDWEDVKLVLSTGNPSIGGNVPELRPWYIDIHEPVVLERQLNAKMMTVAEESAEYEMAEIMPEIEHNATTAEYHLNVPYTIRSSSDGMSVDIAVNELKAEYIYKSVRKLEKDVFLTAKVTEWEHLDLLAGQANVFFENRYVGEMTIDPSDHDGSLLLSLGRDKNIIVTREKGKDFTSRTVLGSNIRSARSWELNVKNLKAQKISVILEDQVPVSINKAITVDVQNVSGAEYDKETGKLEWNMSLDPSESRSFHVKYVVTHPASKRVELD